VLAATEVQVAEVRDEMAKKESALEVEKFELEQTCARSTKMAFSRQ